MTAPSALRLRVQLTKEGRARFLSHAEFQRNLMLAARRAGLPLAYSEGYRPKMKISLSPPLPIGVTSEGELVDFSLAGYLSPVEASMRLGEALPAGIAPVKARLLGAAAKPVGKIIDTATYRVFVPLIEGREGEWKKAVEQFLERSSFEFERVQPRRTRTVDLRPGVHELRVADASGFTLEMTLDDGTRGTVKPREVLEVLAVMAGDEDGRWPESRVHRLGLYSRRGERLVPAMEAGSRRPAV